MSGSPHPLQGSCCWYLNDGGVRCGEAVVDQDGAGGSSQGNGHSGQDQVHLSLPHRHLLLGSEGTKAHDLVVQSEAEVNVSIFDVNNKTIEAVTEDQSEPEDNEAADQKLKPFVGQIFQSVDEAEEFYTRYAMEVGFDIRRESLKKKQDVITRREWVCNKEGEYKLSMVSTPKRKRGVGRVGCKARMTIIICKEGGYIVSIFDEAHSHDVISPRRRHLMKSRRRLSNAKKCLSEQLTMVNIPPNRQFDIFGVQSGGFENVGCTQRDIYNYRRDEHEKLKGHDGDMLFQHFDLEKERNPSFIYKIETDSAKRITRCFWADASARQNHSSYGDVVIFDTTYNTNRYGMIFAPMMGVNHHAQTIFFSGAFLSDETADSFNWLFKEFLTVMPGGAPKMIITDQDLAMTKAISESLPDTFHRYCSWHILNKFSEKIDSVKHKIYFYDFQNCVWASETKDEFDYRWKSILDKSGLGSNKWLQLMFELRSKWVPAYVDHVFSAGMSSSQRAESGHSFLKNYVGKQNSLVDFMIQYNRGIMRQRQGELIVDHADINEKPHLRTPFRMEKQMAEVYTCKLFYKVQNELMHSFNYYSELIREDAGNCIYNICNDDDGRVWEIVYDKSDDFASCSCQLFQSSGIPCRHVLSFLQKVSNLTILPDQYIMKRWTRSTKHDVVVDVVGSEIGGDTSILEQRSILFSRCSNLINLIDKVVLNKEARQIFCECIDVAVERITPLVGNNAKCDKTAIENTVPCEKSLNCIGVTCEASYNEPNPVAFKGCGKRLKKSKEKATSKAKGRRCNGCGKIGVSHDKRNCPRLVNMSSTIKGDNDSRDDDDSVSLSEDED